MRTLIAGLLGFCLILCGIGGAILLGALVADLFDLKGEGGVFAFFTLGLCVVVIAVIVGLSSALLGRALLNKAFDR